MAQEVDLYAESAVSGAAAVVLPVTCATANPERVVLTSMALICLLGIALVQGINDAL